MAQQILDTSADNSEAKNRSSSQDADVGEETNRYTVRKSPAAGHLGPVHRLEPILELGGKSSSNSINLFRDAGRESSAGLSVGLLKGQAATTSARRNAMSEGSRAKALTMKVKEAMPRSPGCCSLNTNLAAAVEIMWSRNCGFLPIVSSQGEVVGVITDRDVRIALATRNRLPAEITVQEVFSGTAYSCKPDDDIRTALATMVAKRVRRLPVLDRAGRLMGILSVDDVVLHADGHARGSFSPEDLMSAPRKLYESQLRQAQSISVNRPTCDYPRESQIESERLGLQAVESTLVKCLQAMPLDKSRHYKGVEAVSFVQTSNSLSVGLQPERR